MKHPLVARVLHSLGVSVKVPLVEGLCVVPPVDKRLVRRERCVRVAGRVEGSNSPPSSLAG